MRTKKKKNLKKKGVIQNSSYSWGRVEISYLYYIPPSGGYITGKVEVTIYSESFDKHMPVISWVIERKEWIWDKDYWMIHTAVPVPDNEKITRVLDETEALEEANRWVKKIKEKYNDRH